MGNQFRFLFSYRTNKNFKIMKTFIATAALATAAASAAPHDTGIPHAPPHVTNGYYYPSYQQILPSALPFYGGLVPFQPVVQQQQQPEAAEVSVEKREAHETGVPHAHPHPPVVLSNYYPYQPFGSFYSPYFAYPIALPQQQVEEVVEDPEGVVDVEKRSAEPIIKPIISAILNGAHNSNYGSSSGGYGYGNDHHHHDHGVISGGYNSGYNSGGYNSGYNSGYQHVPHGYQVAPYNPHRW